MSTLRRSSWLGVIRLSSGARCLDLIEAGRPVGWGWPAAGCDGPVLRRGGDRIWAWYSLIYATVSGLAGGQFLFDALGVWRWRRHENQAHKTWKGGTDECLIMGNLLRRGPILTPKQWALRSGAPTMRIPFNLERLCNRVGAGCSRR